MNVPTWVWVATLAVLVGVVVLDLILVDSRPHVFGTREATRWVLIYIALALSFAVGLWVIAGGDYAGQFLAGYVTEYSLSVDNLFVFVVIMGSFAVPEQYQHRVLLIGVVLALLLRGILILAGAAAIERFAATFYLFGLLLVFTAIKLVRDHDKAPDPGSNPMVRLLERFVPTTREYHGTKLITTVNGARVVTPMLMVMVAIGTTDLLFALDSIPAIFGLTEEPYIVFTANAFALMGLRQLYFLLNGLLDKLVYLSYGLAVILAFIGVKLIFHAMSETGTLWAGAPDISTTQSLIVIIGVLIVTTVASLAKVRRDPESHSVRLENAQQEALVRQGRELLLLDEEVSSSMQAIQEARLDSSADLLADAEANHDEAVRRRGAAAQQLASLAEEADTGVLPALPVLPRLPELSALAQRAPELFNPSELPNPAQNGDVDADARAEGDTAERVTPPAL